MRLLSRLLIVVVALSASRAVAQPAQEHDDEHPPGEPQSSPQSPSSSPPQTSRERDERADCERERLLILQTASTTADAALRDRLLGIVPDCRPTRAPTVRATRVLGPAPSAPVRPRRGGLFEIGAGFGTAVVSNGGRGTTELAVGTGAGAFLTRDIALELRAAGQVFFDNATGFSGFVGPTLQGWLSPQLFIGGGVGLGLSAASCDTCQTYTSVGFDLRLGYAFDQSGRGAHVSLESTHHTIHIDDGYGGFSLDITTLLFQLGYTMF